MTTATVKVIARITAQPHKIEEVKAILLDLVEPTRKEQGCIGYQLLQNRTNPGDFTFVEEWASDAAIEAHLSMPHVHTAFAKAGALLAGEPDIRRYVVAA